jgi:hypothetical protein
MTLAEHERQNQTPTLHTYSCSFRYKPVFQDLVGEREAGAEQSGLKQNAEHFSQFRIISGIVLCFGPTWSNI